MLSLDHIFIFVPPGTTLPGLAESFRRAHPGQGTANVCYCFDNAYLELLWVDDDDALRAIPRTGLYGRSRWRESDASPFGIALRAPQRGLPFEFWEYAPSYLPPGLTIPMAASSADPRQPLIFQSPGSQPPTAWTDGRAGERQRAAGLTDITGLRLSLPQHIAPCPALRTLAAAGLVTLTPGDRHAMMLCLATADGGERRLSLPDLRFSAD